MNLVLLLPLAVPFGCLAAVSLLAFLGVVALAGALQVVGAIKAGMGWPREFQELVARTSGTVGSATLTRSIILKDGTSPSGRRHSNAMPPGQG